MKRLPALIFIAFGLLVGFFLDVTTGALIGFLGGVIYILSLLRAEKP